MVAAQGIARVWRSWLSWRTGDGGGMAVLQFGSRSFSFDFVVAVVIVVIVVFYFFPLGFYFRVRLMFLQRLPCFL